VGAEAKNISVDGQATLTGEACSLPFKGARLDKANYYFSYNPGAMLK
jgi:hypothetical protein